MLNIIFGRENVPKDKVHITTLNSPWFFYNNKKSMSGLKIHLYRDV